MKKAWQSGKIAGIRLKIHPTFLFLLVWIGFSTFLNGGSIGAVVNEIIFILALFLSVVLHELGHALAAKNFGITTRDITLLPIGGVARLERMPEKPKEELIVAAAGPAVNVIIGGLLFAGLLISGRFAQPLNVQMLMDNFWLRLLTVNITLVLFNLIPAFPMDGGRVLRAILASRINYVKATRTAANIGRGFAILMGVAGLVWNPWLILTAIFIWFGAGSEADAVEMKASMAGLQVRDAMISHFYQVEGNQPLETVFQLSMTTGQQNIPVLSNGHYLGIISKSDLLKSIERLGSRAPAYAAISQEPELLNPDLPLSDVLIKLQKYRVLPVIENGQLIGLVNLDSIQQRIWMNQKLGQTPTYPPNEETDTV